MCSAERALASRILCAAVILSITIYSGRVLGADKKLEAAATYEQLVRQDPAKRKLTRVQAFERRTRPQAFVLLRCHLLVHPQHARLAQKPESLADRVRQIIVTPARKHAHLINNLFSPGA